MEKFIANLIFRVWEAIVHHFIVQSTEKRMDFLEAGWHTSEHLMAGTKSASRQEFMPCMVGILTQSSNFKRV